MHLKLQALALFLPVKLWWDSTLVQLMYTTAQEKVVPLEVNVGPCARGGDLMLSLC